MLYCPPGIFESAALYLVICEEFMKTKLRKNISRSRSINIYAWTGSDFSRSPTRQETDPFFRQQQQSKPKANGQWNFAPCACACVQQIIEEAKLRITGIDC